MLALIAPEGKATSDRRLINPGALTWRENLPLMFRDRDTHGAGSNTPETVHVGNVTNLRRQTIGDETWVVGDVTYDSDEQAMEARTAGPGGQTVRYQPRRCRSRIRDRHHQHRRVR